MRLLILGLASLATMLFLALSISVNRPRPVLPVALPGPFDPNADIVFIGDSITQGWSRDGAGEWGRFGNAQNLGVRGSTTADVSRALATLAGASPLVLVIAVGTNDVRDGRAPADIAASVVSLVDTARDTLPDTEIVVVGILPRACRRYDTNGRAVNALLTHTVSARGASFVQIDIPVTPDVLPDSLHPSAYGYRLIADQLVDRVTRPLLAAR